MCFKGRLHKDSQLLITFLCKFGHFLNDCLFPTATQLRSGGRWLAGEGGQVVDVLMGVDEAALHHIVVSLLCILLVIEEEEVSCLVGIVEVDVQTMMARMVKVQDMSSLVRTQCFRSESQPGDEWGHFGQS